MKKLLLTSSEEFYASELAIKYKNQIDKVDELINSLNCEDRRKLMMLIRKNIVVSKLHLNELTKHFYVLSKIIRERITDSIIIHNLYENSGVVEYDWLIHWAHYKYQQLILNKKYNIIAKLPRQDNKSYINYGNRDGKAGRIRFPRKVRKTAWKRFYKLFPHLKPKE